MDSYLVWHISRRELSNRCSIFDWLIRFQKNNITFLWNGSYYEHLRFKTGDSSDWEIDNCHNLLTD